LIGYFRPSGHEFLCAGAANGDGHVTPVHAKMVVASFLCAGVYENTHFGSKISLASWVPPGSPLTCDVPWVALTGFRFDLNNLMNKSLEK